MASAGILCSEEGFSCSICLDVFTSPVTTPCGHNFCKACITKFWDGQVQYKCPLCNEVFHTRPDSRVNWFLSEMADHIRSVQEKHHSFPDQPCAKPGEVPCDVCTGTQLKAVKSCLVCLTSYCDTHLEPHQRVAGLKRHQLIDPVDRLEDSVEHGGAWRLTPGVRKYACELTLDPNTAYRRLSLSEHNREVTLVKEKQSYPDHPERFTSCRQVLCREGLTGRCYWEVERRGDVGMLVVGVTYRGITRRGAGDDSCLGCNNQSWSLDCDDDGCHYYAWYNKISTAIRLPSSVSTRVGVYVDCSAGTLSFYRVSPHGGGSSGALTHIHTFQTTFTQTVYPGFRLVGYGASVSLCQL